MFGLNFAITCHRFNYHKFCNNKFYYYERKKSTLPIGSTVDERSVATFVRQ